MSLPVNIHGHVGQGSEPPGPVENVHAHCKGERTRWYLEDPSNPNYCIVFYESAWCAVEAGEKNDITTQEFFLSPWDHTCFIYKHFASAC